MSAELAGFCGARSKPAVEGKPDSDFICTADPGHPEDEHTACDGLGHVLARWRTPDGPIETWVPYAGAVRRVVVP